MRFVSAKSEQAQISTVIWRIRTGYIRERTSCMNRIGSILLEFGISFPRDHANMKKLFQWLEDKDAVIPPLLILELRDQLDYYNQSNEKITAQDQKLIELNKENELYALLQTIPVVGPMTASCCLSSVGDPKDFANGRKFAACIGLVPFQCIRHMNPRGDLSVFEVPR
ncbi:Transposase IS116/IS110/IS902 family protein [Vibrio celticus]|uniref:Transposase IS116/IS110/IS902 family protein n=1 Tax=Vibrio celticus TaxID=446372 RepID=A0A1C3JIV6_9VIBR|nr:Transposase IS116/IS110/IS902 family protein [Vibrio celticus]